MSEANEDPRDPYTYACDYIRLSTGGVVISRSVASQIRSAIAKALKMTDEELAVELAEYYKAHTGGLVEQHLKDLQRQGVI